LATVKDCSTGFCCKNLQEGTGSKKELKPLSP